MKYLYCYKSHKKDNDKPTFAHINIETFTPGIKKGFFIQGEQRSFKLVITRLIFQIITFGKAKIFYVCDGTNLVHTSYVVPQCYKFDFLGNNDYEIGPCFTYPKYRGKGIYPSVIQFICNSVGNEHTTFYMIVDENNIQSIKGIEKSGFKKCGIIRVTKFTKKYLIDKNFS